MVTYKEAGVDVEGAERWIRGIRPLVHSTVRPGVLKDVGHFAGLLRLKNAGPYKDPVLVASTDGAGTKIKVAQRFGAHEVIGIDAVAMNTNDVVVYGAVPLFFLDYLAVGKLQPKVMSALVRGLAEGCRRSGCTLLGGETAEMPGVYEPGEYDVAGFCVGMVEREQLIDGSRVRPGDAIVGLASSGVHANGFSLVRKVFTEGQLARYRRQLLVPTRIYVKPVLQAVARLSIHAITHVTGGGLRRRLPSVVARRPGLRVHVIPKSWPVPPIFEAIQRAGRLTSEEMFATFNMGVGMALVCSPGDVARLIHVMAQAMVPAWRIGTVDGSLTSPAQRGKERDTRRRSTWRVRT